MDDHDRILQAAGLAVDMASIEGSHHKTWTIDQMLRILLADEYSTFVASYEKEFGQPWPIGIAP